MVDVTTPSGMSAQTDVWTVAIVLGMTLVTAGGLLLWVRVGPASWMARWWASQNLVHLDAGLAASTVLVLRLRMKVAGCSLLGVAVVVGVTAAVDRALVMMVFLASSGLALVAEAVISTVLTARATRSTRTRHVARVRAVAVSDYVSPGVRYSCWFSGAAAVAGAVVVASGVADERSGGAARVAVVALIVQAAVVVLTEWAARKVVAEPVTAQDAAHLYWQDALRSDTVLDGFLRAPLSVSLMMMSVPDMVLTPGVSTDLAPAFLATAAVLILVSLGLSTARLAATPRFRTGLWPMLGAYEVLHPGLPVGSAERSGA
jgi:hypothetical protein